MDNYYNNILVYNYKYRKYISNNNNTAKILKK